MIEYLNAVKGKNGDKYDLLMQKTSKFLFYSFNNFLNRIGKQLKVGRHAKISDDDFVLKNLQEKKIVLFCGKTKIILFSRVLRKIK